ncbi:hypothetical protein M1466_03120 [Candidatus Dependentiae bacterium]|nr:hypothetical protein [Candidatus Dependentiae bacterium]
MISKQMKLLAVAGLLLATSETVCVMTYQQYQQNLKAERLAAIKQAEAGGGLPS